MCLCPNPNALQRWLQRVWSGLSRLRAQTFSSFSASVAHGRVHARACTCRHVYVHARTPGLPNRNTQHAVSWTLSLGFGWREAQFSTPVFGAVIRGLFLFQERAAHTHVQWSTQREHWWSQFTLWHLLDNKWRVSMTVESLKSSANSHIFPVPGQQRSSELLHTVAHCEVTGSCTQGYLSGKRCCLLVTFCFEALSCSTLPQLNNRNSYLDFIVGEAMLHLTGVANLSHSSPFCSEIACGAFLNPPSHVASTSETTFATSMLVTPV